MLIYRKPQFSTFKQTRQSLFAAGISVLAVVVYGILVLTVMLGRRGRIFPKLELRVIFFSIYPMSTQLVVAIALVLTPSAA